MGKPKFYYNTQSLQYEEYQVPVKTRLFRIVGVFCSILFAGCVLYLLADHYLPSQKEKALMSEIDQMKYHYSKLNAQLSPDV